MTQQDKLPEETLDDIGYPTEEFLCWIADYSPDETINITRFIETIRDNWNWGESTTKLSKPRKGKQKLELHTGGWSGNEGLISALLMNKNISFLLKYVMWKCGGHYYFELKTPPKTP